MDNIRSKIQLGFKDIYVYIEFDDNSLEEEVLKQVIDKLKGRLKSKIDNL